MTGSSNQQPARFALENDPTQQRTHRQLLMAIAVLTFVAMAGAGVRDNYTEPTTYTYKTVGGLPIKADVYRLAGDEVRPIIVWIHGGALIMGQRGGPSLAQGRGYLHAGCVMFSID